MFQKSAENEEANLGVGLTLGFYTASFYLGNAFDFENHLATNSALIALPILTIKDEFKMLVKKVEIEIKALSIGITTGAFLSFATGMVETNGLNPQSHMPHKENLRENSSFMCNRKSCLI